MRNKVYYIKPEESDVSEAIKIALIKALSIVSDRHISNIKLIVSHMDIVDGAPNNLSSAFDKLFSNKGVAIVNSLRKDRGIPMKGWPTDEETTGINLVPAKTMSTQTNEATVGVLVFSDVSSLIKVQSILFRTEIDLICVIHHETEELNEILSALKAINLSKDVDPNVIPYSNNFTEKETEIINRLKGINVTSHAAHTPTQESMKSVINELKKSAINIKYEDFLGFLLNDVNYNLDDSIDLLNWKSKYFNR